MGNVRCRNLSAEPGGRASWSWLPGCLLSVLHGSAESFLAAQVFLLGEVAHVGVRAPETVRLGEELGKGDQYLGDLLERVEAQSGGGERLTGLLEGGIGSDRPSGLGKELPGEGVRRSTRDSQTPSTEASESGRALASPASTWMPGRRGIWARIAAAGSTARMLRPNQSLKAAAN